MILATPHDQLCCLPGTYRLRVVQIKARENLHIKWIKLQTIFSQHQPLCKSSKVRIWKKNDVKVICKAFRKTYNTNEGEVTALYLIAEDYGLQTVSGFSKNQLVVHLCQMLQHLLSRYKVFMRLHFVLSIVQWPDTLWGWPGPLYDRLWRCRPSAAAGIWAVWLGAGDAGHQNYETVPLIVVLAAGQPPLNCAPYIVSRYSCL